MRQVLLPLDQLLVKLAVGTQTVSWMFGFVPACLTMYTPSVLMERFHRPWALKLGLNHFKESIQRDVERLSRLMMVILKTDPIR